MTTTSHKLKNEARTAAIILHPASERGVAEEGWLSSRFSFSFAGFHDPAKMGFGALRVLNDDTIAPGTGFPTHPHSNMEIVTILLSGTLEHKDSTGASGVLREGDVQAMSAGKGIFHSEFNRSKTEELRLLQLWIQTRERGIAPRHEQHHFGLAKDGVTTLVTPDGGGGTLRIAQDATIARARIRKDAAATVSLNDNNALPGTRGIYLFMIDGDATVEGHRLSRRDAIGIAGIDRVEILAATDADLLLINVPM